MSQVSHPSAFIVLEGLDCAGKSYQITALAERLRKQGRTVLQAADPGTTPVAKMVREILLNPANKEYMSPGAELMLFAAARASLVDYLREELKKNRNTVILCDRFIHSTIAYQQMGRGIDVLRMRASLNAACYGFFPTLTIYMDITEETIQKRMAIRAEKHGIAVDRLDGESVAFRQRVRKGYEEAVRLAFAGYGDITSVEADGERDEVTEKLYTIITQHLEERKQDYEEYKRENNRSDSSREHAATV